MMTVLAAFALCGVLAPAGSFCTSARATEGEAADDLVSIDFNDVDINVFIRFISELTGRNFIIDQRVKGKVTIISPGRITAAEAYKVFESVLEVHNYSTVRAGEIIKIIPSPDARGKSIETRLMAEAGSSGDKIVTQIIRLRYADPNEIKKLFTPLVSKNSVILSYGPTNTIIVTDVSSNINRLLRILKAIDISGIGREISVIPLQFAGADKLVKLLESMFKNGKNGSKGEADRGVKMVADRRTNTVILLASEDETDRIRELIRLLDKKIQRGKEKFHVYYLENSTAEDLAKVLQDLVKKRSNGNSHVNGKKAPVVSDKVKITADKATNSLIIMAEKDDYEVLEEIIAKLDIPRSMVYIEALIMEVNMNSDFAVGTEWSATGEGSYNGKSGVYGGGYSGGAGQDSANKFTITPSIPNPLDPSQSVGVPYPAGFSLGIFGEAIDIGGIAFPSISAVVQAYKEDKDFHILSTPQILTTDNEEATIVVGKNMPFQTKTSTSENDTYNSFEYRDVGKTLKITPHVSKDRLVRLNLSLMVTSLEDKNDDRPTTYKREVQTTVIVKDSNTVVLGGLIDSATTAADYTTPCLGDVPVFGWAFKSVSDVKEQTNLYIFLTPRVVQSASEADEIFRTKREQIDKIKEGKVRLYEEEEGEESD
ncbi:MAG: type II secretion system secretin GspD [Desulfobacterales bacterium]|nr:type II secretion system secretin GspD [Desulfobacterales bacterium]